MKARMIHLAHNLLHSRAAFYLQCLILLLLVMGAAMGSTACFSGCSCGSSYSLLSSDLPLPDTVELSAQGRYAEAWLELGVSGIYTPTQTERGWSVITPDGQTPFIEKGLKDRAYIAIRVPHAPPAYTPSVLLPGIPPHDPHALTFNYYAPPSSASLTTVPISVTRRMEYEPIVNARFPITDGHSHWEVWWLPEGAELPIPDEPFRLDKDSWPTPFALRFRLDFVDAKALACAGCSVEVVFFNGYVFIGPYAFKMRFSYPSVPREPLVSFGVHCVIESEALAPTFGHLITPNTPFTQIFCLENWDTAARTYTIEATSTRGWEYRWYYQSTARGSKPVAVKGIPFSLSVPKARDEFPGMMALLAVYTPTIALDDKMRETLFVTATSTSDADVWASTVGLALPPGYDPSEGSPAYRLYLPLGLKRYP